MQARIDLNFNKSFKVHDFLACRKHKAHLTHQLILSTHRKKKAVTSSPSVVASPIFSGPDLPNKFSCRAVPQTVFRLISLKSSWQFLFLAGLVIPTAWLTWNPLGEIALPTFPGIFQRSLTVSALGLSLHFLGHPEV